MKTIKDYINESLNNEFEFNISQFESGKLEDERSFNKIVKSLESKNDTHIRVNCGKLGECEIDFSNFHSNVCDISIILRDLGKYVKFDKEVDSEWADNGPWRDLYRKMFSILRSIKNKVYNL